jgi:TRAP-type C4-dicarboxylate transport system permease small subunit
MLRLLKQHIVILGGAAALIAVVAGIERNSASLLRDGIAAFGWHALAIVAISLPAMGIALLFRRIIHTWRTWRFRKLMRQFEDDQNGQRPRV